MIALLSDIHGNLEALNACLRHAAERGAQRYAFLGDYVGYGADVEAVVEIVSTHAAQGALALKGNHDEAIDRSSFYFNDVAEAGLAFARGALGAEQKHFLASLPLIVRDGEMCFVHASAASPQRWEYIDSPTAAVRCIDAAGVAYTFCGHVHDQLLYSETGSGRVDEFRPVPGTPIPMRGQRRWLAIVGSVGQPRDRDPTAAYTLFDLERRQITFFRVAYDAMAAAAKVRACGLPEFLAYRVEVGI